ncbi:hypothetical protein BDE02_14G012500 [Populus trichocarpa]|nr:hypothetical protein BDE02_14G012500 [Populus trichocarpa]
MLTRLNLSSCPRQNLPGLRGRSELGLYRQQHQVIWSFPCCVIALCSEQAILFAREENCGSVIEDVYLII